MQKFSDSPHTNSLPLTQPANITLIPPNNGAHSVCLLPTCASLCLPYIQTAAPSEAAPSKEEEEEEESGDAPDESGLDPDEITTVMNQANCSRAKAVKALKKHKNIVDAILELTP